MTKSVFRRRLWYSLLSISTFVGVVMLVVLVVLVAVPGVRYGAFRVLAELPTIVTNFAVRGPVFGRKFKSAAAGLERQLSLSSLYGSKRSMNLPGLVENTEFVIERVHFARDYAYLSPYLRDLVRQHPELHLARLWLARALLSENPAAAFEHLEAAVKLVPADGRAYRIAVQAALELDSPDIARQWCQRYRGSQFGGPHPYRYNNTFEGAGLRELALEAIAKNGEPWLVVNAGLRLDEPVTYDFDLPHRYAPGHITLHLGLLPGVKVKVHDITISGPRGVRTIPVDKLWMSARYGYIAGRDTLITVSTDGDILKFWPTGEPFGEADRVDLKLTISRMDIVSGPPCSVTEKPG